MTFTCSEWQNTCQKWMFIFLGKYWVCQHFLRFLIKISNLWEITSLIAKNIRQIKETSVVLECKQTFTDFSYFVILCEIIILTFFFKKFVKLIRDALLWYNVNKLQRIFSPFVLLRQIEVRSGKLSRFFFLFYDISQN